MKLDSLVARFEESLLPIVRAQEVRLRTSGRFTKVDVFSMRHADTVHAMGIACRPLWALTEFERLGFSVTLLGFNGLSGRIDIQWSQDFSAVTGTGYLKKETKGFHSRFESDAQISEFEAQWNRFARLFVRVAAKGKPSMRLTRRLRGAPWDLHGWKAAEST